MNKIKFVNISIDITNDLLDIISANKSKSQKQAGHVACMDNEKCV
jgi:hypothetical protein